MGLEGSWFNELGSTMQIDSVQGGLVAGSYQTAVSTGCASGSFALSGRTDVDSGGQSVGWVVSWTNGGTCRSVTSWAGQYQVVDGAEQITALWLLAQATTPDENWESTLVGQDVFTRTPASGSRPAAARRHSHP